MSADDDRFDPRFDPAFQRGYSGPAPTAPAPVSRPATETPRQQPTKPRVVEPEHPVRQTVPVDELEYIDDTPVRRTNPFLIGLGAVALILVGGGLYLISRMRDLFASTENQNDFDFITMQVLVQLAPIIVSLGLATAIGVLFIYAVRWGRR
jgi:hypothetical protein